MNPSFPDRATRSRVLRALAIGFAVAVLAAASALTVEHSGNASSHLDCADVNQSGDVNSADIIHLVNFVFRGGAAPDCPGLTGEEAVDLLLRGATETLLDPVASARLRALAGQVRTALVTGDMEGARAGLGELGDSAIVYYSRGSLREFEMAEILHVVVGITPGLVTPAFTGSPSTAVEWWLAYRHCIRDFADCKIAGGTDCIDGLATCIEAWGNCAQPIAEWDKQLAELNYFTCINDDLTPGNPTMCALVAAHYLLSGCH